MKYRQFVNSFADRAADIGCVYRSRQRSVISGSASPEPGAGLYRGRCGCTGKIPELRRQPGVKPDNAIACPGADVRQAEQPGHITGIGYLFHRWELGARLQGGHCRGDRIDTVGGIGYGMQQH